MPQGRELEDCIGFHRDIPLARLNTTASGYPYHLISGTSNYIRRQSQVHGSVGHFLFSQLYCGNGRVGFESTKTYCGGTLDLASAMTMSSAAVSPAHMKNVLVAVLLLLLLLNFRLGQWLPNPGYKPWWPARWQRYWARWPAPILVMINRTTGLLSVRPKEEY